MYYENESLGLAWDLRAYFLCILKLWLKEFYLSHKSIIENMWVVYLYARFKKDFFGLKNVGGVCGCFKPCRYLWKIYCDYEKVLQIILSNI